VGEDGGREGGLWLRVEAEGLAGCLDCKIGNQDTVLKMRILFGA
jgi:hypothetical protein